MVIFNFNSEKLENLANDEDAESKTILEKMQKLQERVCFLFFKLLFFVRFIKFVHISKIKKKNKHTDPLVKLKEEQANLASELTQKFDTIEQESGIFLIKPMLSYHGK